MSIINFLFFLFLISGILGSGLSIYEVYILKKKGYETDYSNLGFFKHFKDLYNLSKKEKEYKKLFFLAILTTLLPILFFVLIAIYAIYS
jgi:hypothetical protein